MSENTPVEYNHEKYVEKGMALVEASKCYEVILSTKDRIKCDSDELERVIAGIKTGSMIKLRQGFINPSFIVTIVMDDQRFGDIREKVQSTLQHNHQAITYSGGQGLNRLPEFKRLKDIFSGTKLTAAPIKPALNAPKHEN